MALELRHQRLPDNTIQIMFGGSIDLNLGLRWPPPRREIVPLLTARYQGFTVTARGHHMAYTLPDDHMVDVQVVWADAHGHPAQVQGDTTWASSDESIVTVAADSGDSTMCAISPSASANLGTAQVTATADADLGDGVTAVVATFDVTTVAGTAVAGTISPTGDAQPIAPTPTPTA